MKKIVLFGIVGLAVMAAAGTVAFRTIAAKETGAEASKVTPTAAASLQRKIDSIRNAADNPKHKRGSSRVELSEPELEAYLLYALKEDIPAQIDSAGVRIGQDSVGLDTQITFASNATGNTVVDTLVGGTHNLSLQGKLIAQDGRGKFDLQDVRVDGIPVPNVLVHTLIRKYVKPKYPEVDLNEAFDMPWGIERIKLDQGKATVIY